MTTFRNHSAEILRRLNDANRPVIRTVNGKAAAVVQDAEAYQHRLDLAPLPVPSCALILSTAACNDSESNPRPGCAPLEAHIPV